MDTILTLVFTFLTIGGAILAIQKTGSFFVGILVGIIIVMIWRSVKVPLLILWDRFAEKHFPLPAIHHFYEEGLDGEQIGGLLPLQLGMRVLIITETLECTPETEKLFYILVDASKKALAEEYPLFKLRSLAVKKRKSPLQYSSTICGEDGENFKKCFKAWDKTEAVHLMTSRVQNKDFFLYDGGLAVDGKIINYSALYLFDSTLPVTVEVLDQLNLNDSDDTTEGNTEENTENKAAADSTKEKAAAEDKEEKEVAAEEAAENTETQKTSENTDKPDPKEAKSE